MPRPGPAVRQWWPALLVGALITVLQLTAAWARQEPEPTPPESIEVEEPSAQTPEAPTPATRSSEGQNLEAEVREEAFRRQLESVEETVQEHIDEALERANEAIETAEERRAEGRERRRRVRSDRKVAIGSSVKVNRGEVADNVVAIGGGVKVDGEVLGDAVAIGGSAKINGRVTGQVVAVAGGVELGSEAEVLGDVVSVGGRVEREPGATVLGEINEVAFGEAFEFDLGDWDLGDWDLGDWDFGDWRRPLFRMGSIFELVMALVGTGLLILACSIIVLIVPNAVEKVQQRAFAEPAKSLVVGLLIQVLFLPVLVLVCLLLVITIIGIPLLALIPFVLLALFLLALLGFASVALGCGDWLKDRFALSVPSPYLALLTGILAVQALSLVAELLDFVGFPFFFTLMFGLCGFFAKYVAWTVGIGSVFLTRFAGDPASKALPPAPDLPASASPQPPLPAG